MTKRIHLIHRLLLIFAFIGINSIIRAQILNIDRENGQDSISRKQLLSVNLDLSLDKQQNNLIELSSQFEYDRFFKNDQVLVFLFNSDASLNGSIVLENNGYFQTRLRNNDKKRLAPDFYTQYQWNGVLGLQNRALAGCNARFKFWDDRTDDLYMSLGIFYEIEKWNPNLGSYAFEVQTTDIVLRQIPRLNYSVKTAFKITKGIDFAASAFLQFPMNDAFTHFTKPRLFVSSNLNFEVNKHLSFLLHFDQNLDYYRPLPIDPFYYNLNFGIQLKW